MNTILTDDERLMLSAAMTGKPEDILAIEAAVLAKLREQEPVAMRYDFDGYGYRYIDSGSGSDWRTRIPDAEAVYAAPLPAVMQVPQGWKLVPVEPTDEMVEAAWESDAVDYVGEHKRIWRADMAFKAMLAAAPEAPARSIARNAPDRMKPWISLHNISDDEFTAFHIGFCCGEQSIPAPWREAVKVAREALGNPDFLDWLADRLVHVYGESPTVDFAACLRRKAKSDRAALARIDALEGGQ